MKSQIILIVGALTVILSLLTKVVGFPDQMRKNFNRKSTEGVSTIFFAISFLSYVLWTLHGILQGDPVVYLGQGLGVITTGIILWQVYLYRNRQK
ncbi:hypothetical protein A2841_02325 [Candidatus Kaiserbacteria bacterium RIFCSPHIGHO2_01_FULL_48_10]|uniref:MtN3 and saliva related transmembrane protein n=1 Tax=Candidatus Kaiserbacteria bacterium RIFCSPHIGHO2_01_FULL_48_10 TaxID=1798476 RepID=A0A1F6C6N6_9BACT|nr:MAG: hypothetical protein A2841_02325 [Candidatus Kaiserbacteria bacterium RIFCSPHIGHO2_01_FULL_48_10]